MILIIELENLYKKSINNENAVFNYTHSSLKELQTYLKSLNDDVLKEISATSFQTWKELTDTLNTKRKTLQYAFYIKEVK